MMIHWRPLLGAVLATTVATAAIIGAAGKDGGGDLSEGLDDGLLPDLARTIGFGDASRDAVQTRTIDALAGIVDREVEERLRLEDELEALRHRLVSLESRLGATAVETPAVEAPPPVGRDDRGAVAEAAFVAAGFSETEAAYYRRRSDEAAMASLYLRDRADREGWLNSQRYREALAALPDVDSELRAEMDDETYARYLYATGRPNQTRVQRVLGGSAAENAGLRNGDVLLRYDGQRIYNSRDVRRSTRSGTAGETVALEVLRGGRRLQVYLPRGPLGVSMSSESVSPQESGS